VRFETLQVWKCTCHFFFCFVINGDTNTIFLQFALRWRTEAEVLSGAGESTCGNTRCKHHEETSAGYNNDDRYSSNQRIGVTESSHPRKKKSPALTTVELPFAYIEHGETKSALVKVVLCEKCLGKLMWKRRKEKEALAAAQQLQDPELTRGIVKEEEEGEERSLELVQVKQENDGSGHNLDKLSNRSDRSRGDRADRWERDRDIDGDEVDRMRRRDRSRSPHRDSKTKDKDRHHGHRR
jgi:protein FRA10AC1